jgi:glycosyltransferase involved in cell wall biosynthesis
VGVIYDLLALDPATSPNRRSAIVERLTLRSTVRRARALWCISQATADELVARHPEARAKVEVVPLGVSPELAQDGAGDGLPGPGFVLAVGTLEPRKNLPRLVSAYSSLAVELQTEHPLVVVGAHGWRTGETLSALESLGSRGVLLGEVSDGELAELYRRCAVFCYPSLGEGFGLPVLEAMAAGAAVLTSEDSSLPEVGGDAVEYADPRSVASITDGLDRLLRAPERRAELGERARVRAGCFSWEETAARVLELLEQTALTERSSPPSRTRTRTS